MPSRGLDHGAYVPLVEMYPAAPLFVTLGAAAGELGTQRAVIDGFRLGMARRSVQFG